MNLFLSAYTSVLHLLAKSTVLGGKERAVSDYGPPARGATVGTRSIDFLSGERPFLLATDDYDQMPEDGVPWLATAIVTWVNDHVPIDDSGTRWRSALEAEHALMAAFSDLLPSPSLRWQDPANDEAFRWFCTQSVIAHRLERDPGSGGYRLPLAWMQAYAVRPGLEPVGSDAHFDEALNPVRIEGFRGRTVQRGEPDWEMAKFHFRSAATLCATILDHAAYAHLGIGNAMVIATRRSLDVDHPLRRLLSPFHIKTIGINGLADITLLGRGAIVNRLAAFTWDALKQLYRDGQSNARLESVPELLARNGTGGMGARYPWAEDALALWTAIERFVAGNLALYYDEQLHRRTGDRADARVVGVGGVGGVALYRDGEAGHEGGPDPQLARWAKDIASLWAWPAERMPKMETRTELAAVVSVMIWVVTGWHQHIAIPTYLARTPAIFSYAIPAGAGSAAEMWPTREQSNLNMLLVALTSPAGPRLMQDFSHFMLDERARAGVRAFHAELSAISNGIRERNEARDFPIEVFDPFSLEISIST